MIQTRRLTVLPATLALARAELGERAEFQRLLGEAVPGALVPESWPPETLADALGLFLEWFEATPNAVGWFGWYGLTTGDTDNPAILVASGGFLGPPQQGTVQIGYSVLPEYQGRGYATELVSALLKWAIAQPGVARVVAETEWANPASVRVLTKVGFVPAEPTGEPAGARFEFVPTP